MGFRAMFRDEARRQALGLPDRETESREAVFRLLGIEPPRLQPRGLRDVLTREPLQGEGVTAATSAAARPVAPTGLRALLTGQAGSVSADLAPDVVSASQLDWGPPLITHGRNATPLAGALWDAQPYQRRPGGYVGGQTPGVGRAPEPLISQPAELERSGVEKRLDSSGGFLQLLDEEPELLLVGNRKDAKKSAKAQRAEKIAAQEVKRKEEEERNKKDHKKARPSTKNKHQLGKARRAQDQGNEKGDKRRLYTPPLRLFLPPYPGQQLQDFLPPPVRLPGETEDEYQSRIRFRA